MSNSTITFSATISEVWDEQVIHQSFYIGLLIFGELMAFALSIPASFLLPLAHIVPSKAYYPIDLIAKTYGPALKGLREQVDELMAKFPLFVELLCSGLIMAVLLGMYFLTLVTPLAQAHRVVNLIPKWRVSMRLTAIAILAVGVVVSASLAFEEAGTFVPVRKCSFHVGLMSLALGVSFIVESVICSIERSTAWLGHGPGLAGLALILQSLPSQGLLLARRLQEDNPQLADIFKSGGLTTEGNKALWPHDQAFFEFLALIMVVHIFSHTSKIVPGFYQRNRLYLTATALIAYIAYFVCFLARDTGSNRFFAMGSMSMTFGPIIIISVIVLSSLLLYGMGSLLVGDSDVLVGYRLRANPFQPDKDILWAIWELFFRSVVTSARMEFVAERNLLYAARETWLGPPEYSPGASKCEAVPSSPYARETSEAVPELKKIGETDFHRPLPTSKEAFKLWVFYLRCMYRKAKAKVLGLSEEERRIRQLDEAKMLLEKCRRDLESEIEKSKPKEAHRAIYIAVPEPLDSSDDWVPGCSDEDSDTGDDEYEDYSSSDCDRDHYDEDVRDDKLVCAETIMQALEAGDTELAAAHLRSSGPLTRRKFAKHQLDEAHEAPKLASVIAQNRSLTPGSTTSSDNCVICYGAPRDIICWPCRCFALCNDCRESLSQAQSMLCVSCRQPIQSYSRIFRP